jgi:sulfate adenylyltransferase large subunit
MSAQLSAEEELIDKDILGFLARHESKELLRFVIVGSVDDGKSTLIGRMLFELQAVYEDQLEAVRKATTMVGVPIDFSLITDGLEAERAQGITIDVAYRYFTTEKRKFIVADTPGHVQYTRNMVTGASTADVGIILIDARLGVLEQSRRHAFIASLLGIPHLLVAVNKMDLVEYGEARFNQIRDEFRKFCDGLNFKDVTFVPVSALLGENVVQRGANMPWYTAHTVLGFLENVPIAEDRNLRDFRYPVQYVLRPNLNYRAFAGQISTGIVKKGDRVMVLPSGKTSKVKGIDTYDGEIAEAFAPQSVAIRLEDEIDCSRGDMLVHPENAPRIARSFDAHVVWLHEKPLDPARSYFLKHTSQNTRMQVEKVHCKVDLATLTEREVPTLELNDIGRLRITCHRPLFYDAYRDNRGTGSFVIVDALSNATVGAGMIAREAGKQDLAAALRELAREAAEGQEGIGQSFDPQSTYVQLDDGGASRLLPVTPDFWATIDKKKGLDHARLVGSFGYPKSWDNWEMHPEGDELIVLLSGALDLIFEEAHGPRTVELRGRAAIVVPRGVWHTANVHEPAEALHVTWGAGTLHRPR